MSLDKKELEEFFKNIAESKCENELSFIQNKDGIMTDNNFYRKNRKNNPNFDLKLIEALKTNQNIVSLELSATVFDNKTWDELLNVLDNHKSIKRLMFVYAKDNINIHALRLLSIVNNNALTELHFHMCTLDNNFLMLTAMLLENNKSLAKLTLNSSGVRADVATAIGIYLAKNKTLKELDLTGNSLGSQGFLALANVLLKENTTLTSLNVFETGINNGHKPTTDTATLIKTIIALINKNILQTLNIGGCNLMMDLGDRRRFQCEIDKEYRPYHQSIAKALATNTSLVSLGLGGTDIERDGLLALAACLDHNFTLCDIQLGQSNAVQSAQVSTDGTRDRDEDDLITTKLIQPMLNRNQAKRIFDAVNDCLDTTMSHSLVQIISDYVCLANNIAPAPALEQMPKSDQKKFKDFFKKVTQEEKIIKSDQVQNCQQKNAGMLNQYQTSVNASNLSNGSNVSNASILQAVVPKNSQEEDDYKMALALSMSLNGR